MDSLYSSTTSQKWHVSFPWMGISWYWAFPSLCESMFVVHQLHKCLTTLLCRYTKECGVPKLHVGSLCPLQQVAPSLSSLPGLKVLHTSKCDIFRLEDSLEQRLSWAIILGSDNFPSGVKGCGPGRLESALKGCLPRTLSSVISTALDTGCLISSQLTLQAHLYEPVLDVDTNELIYLGNLPVPHSLYEHSSAFALKDYITIEANPVDEARWRCALDHTELVKGGMQCSTCQVHVCNSCSGMTAADRKVLSFKQHCTSNKGPSNIGWGVCLYCLHGNPVLGYR